MAPETAGPMMIPTAQDEAIIDIPNAWLVLSDASPRIALEVPRRPVYRPIRVTSYLPPHANHRLTIKESDSKPQDDSHGKVDTESKGC